MKLRDGQVAAITGAGSGIGRALALACARRGIQLALADVDSDRLEATAALTRAEGVRTSARIVDVTDRQQVDEFASHTLSEFEACHLLFNNAGVLILGGADEATPRDWSWVMDINLLGIVHGVEAFLPHFLERGAEAHIVNTVSLRGMVPTVKSAVYCASKFAALGYSEALALDLEPRGVGVTAICPWAVRTELMDHQEDRPKGVSRISEEYVRELETAARSAEIDVWMTPDQVAELSLEGIEANELYVLTHPLCRSLIEKRTEAMLASLDRLAERHPELPRS